MPDGALKHFPLSAKKQETTTAKNSDSCRVHFLPLLQIPIRENKQQWQQQHPHSSLLKRLLISPKSVRLLPLAVLSPSRLFSTKPEFAKPEFVVDAFAPHAHDYDDFHLAVIRRLPYPSFAHVTDEGLNIREDMPGLGKEDLEVLVEPNKLIIKGERKMEQEIGGVVYKYSASYYISEEKFNLNQVKAEIKNGELNVVVPKVTKDHKGD